MKSIIFLLCFTGCCCNFAWSQQSPKTVKDTSHALKRKYQPVVVPDPPVTGPMLRTDTPGYQNKVYQNGIKGAEYQNRGAEDRRNPVSDDPKAIPKKEVPDDQRAQPVK